jgi:hypothetical protein
MQILRCRNLVSTSFVIHALELQVELQLRFYLAVSGNANEFFSCNLQVRIQLRKILSTR